jgi:hypothetical protein
MPPSQAFDIKISKIIYYPASLFIGIIKPTLSVLVV